MSPEDIDDALNDLTKSYRLLVSKYGGHLFNYQDFRNRYLHALKQRIDMNVFFRGEKSFLQKQELAAQKYLQSMTAKNEEESFIDKTFNQIISQTDSYPEADIDDRANIEIKRLVGVCRLIYPELANISIYIPPERNTLFYQENKVIQNVVKEPYGFLFKSYLEALDNSFLAQAQLDKIGQRLIKELAIALQSILSILRMTDPVKVGHMVEYISNVLTDFRLEIFKGLV